MKVKINIKKMVKIYYFDMEKNKGLEALMTIDGGLSDQIHDFFSVFDFWVIESGWNVLGNYGVHSILALKEKNYNFQDF